jgi:hypothetical protein
MLSPNARKRSTASFGGKAMVTVNVQALVRCFASDTVQFTVEVPVEKVDPLEGVQVGPVIGAKPEVTVGAGYVTVISPGACVINAAGHVRLGAPGSGGGVGVGVVALAPQPAAAVASNIDPTWNTRRLILKRFTIIDTASIVQRRGTFSSHRS